MPESDDGKFFRLGRSDVFTVRFTVKYLCMAGGVLHVRWLRNTTLFIGLRQFCLAVYYPNHMINCTI